MTEGIEALSSVNEWRIGQPVVKPDGYPFPGTVRAVFTNEAGALRLVVENADAPGLLHIFSPSQVRRVEGDPTPR